MKLFVLAALIVCGLSKAEAATWQPSAGHVQIRLWPQAAPDLTSKPGPESARANSGPVAGLPWLAVENVSVPSITFYPAPKERNSRATAVVFPGGGFQILAIDLEGTEVCERLNTEGISCVLLKYRVPGLPYNWRTNSRPDNLMLSTESLEDVQRAMGLVRSRAKEWNLDRNKIGVIGFSAGGYLVAEISNVFKKRLYALVDEADRESCRPDFAAAIYPGHLSSGHKKMELNKNIKVTVGTPPTFLVQAQDDSIDGINQSLVYYTALKKSAVPVEMHLYAQGGHAFGLRETLDPITRWPGLMLVWLRTIKMIPN